jgi:putative ABC transport system substrate-binding protein
LIGACWPNEHAPDGIARRREAQYFLLSISRRGDPVINRRTFVCIFGSVLVLDSSGVLAQPVGKVYRIGFLASSSPSTPGLAGYVEEFRRGLRELGYDEGSNIVIEYRYANGNNDRLPALVAELLRLGVHVIVTEGTSSTVAAKRAAGTVPIVMALVGDPVGTGLVESLARPGANVTGVTTLAFALVGKQMELLKEVVPSLSTLAVLWNPDHRPSAVGMENIIGEAHSLRLELQKFEARRADDLEVALAEIGKIHPSALLPLPTPELDGKQIRIAEFSLRNRLPAIYNKTAFAEAGGLMTYGARFPDLFRRAASYVDKILKGAKPADLPVEQPTKFELVINLKTAKALGITIPQSLLLRADQLIQ